MFASLNLKIADRITDCLATTGSEGRALKLVRAYRNDPTETASAEAVTALNGLGENKLTELKQAARI